MTKRKQTRKKMQIEVIEIDVSELTPDPDNANLGTERGDYMLARSLEKYGAGRSIVVDKNLVEIAGNKTAAKWGEMGADRVLVIPTDGRTLIAVQRQDWDVNENEGVNPAREYAFADNRIGEMNLKADDVAIIRAVDAGVDLGDLWFDDELAEIRADLEYDRDMDFDEFDDPATGDNVAYRVVVDGLTRRAAEKLAAKLPAKYADDAMIEQYRMANK